MNLDKAKIQVAKIIDEYIGRLVIALYRFWGCKHPTDTRSKILFIKFWGIGSIILSEPAIRWLREQHPHAEIHYLTLQSNTEIFRFMPAVSKVYTLPFGNLLSFVVRCLLIVRALRRENYCLIVDGEFFVNCSAIMARLVGANQIVGFARHKSAKKHLLDLTVPFRDDLHTSKQFLNLVQKRVNLTEPPPVPRLFLKENGALNSLVDARRPCIVMNINASPLATERRWPRERFTELARALLDRFEFDVILIGTKSEMDYVKPLASAFDHSHRFENLTGQLNLTELAHIIKHASLFISNDSGPIHLASAFRVPVVGFYGPETPVRYGPLSPRKLVFYRDLWCSPCMSVENAKTVRCINNLMCMKHIETEDVIAEVSRFIENRVRIPLKKRVLADA